MYRYTENMTLPQPVQSLEIHKKESSVVENTLTDVLLLLDTPHYLIDALAHLVILFHEHAAERKSKRAELFRSERKCAFFATYFRKMEAEQYWLLHKEMEAAIEVKRKQDASPSMHREHRIEEISWGYLFHQTGSSALR